MLEYHWLNIPEPRLWQWTFAIYPPPPSCLFRDALRLDNFQRIQLTSFDWVERFEFEEHVSMLLHYGASEEFAENAAFERVWRSRDRALTSASPGFSSETSFAALEPLGTIEGKCLQDLLGREPN